MSNLPEIWALDEAVKRTLPQYSVWKHFSDFNSPHTVASRAIIELARLIEKHEPKPIDPMLEIAREFVSNFCDNVGFITTAKQVRDGLHDDRLSLEFLNNRLTIKGNPS